MVDTLVGRAVLASQYEYQADFDAGTSELLEEVTRLCQLVPANSVNVRV
jgi:hypothetical protein